MRSSIVVIMSLTLAWFLSLTSGRISFAAEVRTWTDSTGTHKTEAEFVSLDGEIVTLRKPGTDKTVKLPLVRLSDADQEYVYDLVREMEREAAEKKPSAPRVVTRAEPAAPMRAKPVRPPRGGQRTM